mgnify:CR=1 FL=1
MAVYVDDARNAFGRMIMCHMLADTLDELHAMAEKIGMKASWYQPLSFPHYDVCQMRRVLAIEHGAIQVDRRQIVHIKRRLRMDKQFISQVLERHTQACLPLPVFAARPI